MLIGCIPAYNEAANIGAAIDALRAIGCERVIVTNGQWDNFEPGAHWLSQDGTREIALAHGAEVIDAPAGGWPTEHEARTQYLLGADGDWYLCMDADERPYGTLPANVLDPAAPGPDAYRVEIVTLGTLAQMRLFKHHGRMSYQYTHYTVYSDDRLVTGPVTHDFQFLHTATQDQHRTALKAAFYPARTERELARLWKGNPPQVGGLDGQPGLRYIGDGRWLPGVPARDLTALEASAHQAAIQAAAARGKPLYEPIEHSGD